MLNFLPMIGRMLAPIGGYKRVSLGPTEAADRGHSASQQQPGPASQQELCPASQQQPDPAAAGAGYASAVARIAVGSRSAAGATGEPQRGAAHFAACAGSVQPSAPPPSLRAPGAAAANPEARGRSAHVPGRWATRGPVPSMPPSPSPPLGPLEGSGRCPPFCCHAAQALPRALVMPAEQLHAYPERERLFLVPEVPIKLAAWVRQSMPLVFDSRAGNGYKHLAVRAYRTGHGVVLAAGKTCQGTYGAIWPALLLPQGSKLMLKKTRLSPWPALAPACSRFGSPKTIPLVDAEEQQVYAHELDMMLRFGVAARPVHHYRGPDFALIALPALDIDLNDLTRQLTLGLDRRAALRLFAPQLLGQLSRMHQTGVAHLDIVNTNIVVDLEHGAAELIDFGRSLRLNDYQRSNLGRVGCYPTSLPPPDAAKLGVDFTTDIWAMGATFLGFLSGDPLAWQRFHRCYQDPEVTLAWWGWACPDSSFELRRAADVRTPIPAARHFQGGRLHSADRQHRRLSQLRNMLRAAVFTDAAMTAAVMQLMLNPDAGARSSAGALLYQLPGSIQTRAQLAAVAGPGLRRVDCSKLEHKLAFAGLQALHRRILAADWRPRPDAEAAPAAATWRPYTL